MAKGKYEYWLTAEGLLQLGAWARNGLTDEDIAKKMNISASTLYEWKKKYPEISESLKINKEIVDTQVENALFKRALGYSYTESTKERKLNENTGEYESGHIVVYELSGTGKHKVGFTKYAGGIKNIPTGGKTYKNGAKAAMVYADTANQTKIGSLEPNEKCTCLAKIDGMYLVLYKVNGTSNYKCGFVSYNGGC